MGAGPERAEHRFHARNQRPEARPRLPGDVDGHGLVGPVLRVLPAGGRPVARLAQPEVVVRLGADEHVPTAGGDFDTETVELAINIDIRIITIKSNCNLIFNITIIIICIIYFF